MPPKRRQPVDPEVVRQQFEDWKTKDEYRVMLELYDILKMNNKISETSPDLTGKWQEYFDKFFELCAVYKVKNRLKEFRHEHMRSLFFAQKDQENTTDKTIIKYIIDGFHCSVSPTEQNKAWHLRNQFKAVHQITYYQLAIEDMHDLTPEIYQDKRKELQKLMNEFCKGFPIHIKSGHKLIYEEKLMMVLAPLKSLLEINRKLFFFDLRNTTQGERVQKEFMYKAYVDQYCVCLQECQRILYFEYKDQGGPQISHNPEVRRIFNKLAYENWQNNEIESFYLKPLSKAFSRMQQNLLCLMAKGINYYNTPLAGNQQFLKDLQDVILHELIAERLIGDPLKRDQLNFMYKVQFTIANSTELAKEYLLKKDYNCLSGSIPKLVVYQTILYMRNWLDKKAANEQKLEKDKEKLAAKMKLQEQQEEDQQKQEDNQLSQSVWVSPERRRQLEEEQKKKDEVNKQKDEQQKIQAQLDMETYGRYWIWDFYCNEEHRAIFDECIEQIRHVNSAVQQDIQDEIIREGMIPGKTERHSKELKEASEKLNKLRQMDNDKEDQRLKRPPELWNFPKIVEEKHTFRSIAEPKKCYIDGRIETLEQNIKTLSDHLLTYRQNSWNELVIRVIDALKEDYSMKWEEIEQGT